MNASNEVSDSVAELQGQLVLCNKPVHGLLESQSLTICMLQIHHRLCNGAEQTGETHESEENDDDSVNPLDHVAWNNFHRCRSELGQAPMQRRGVHVTNGCCLINRIHPLILMGHIHSSNDVPAARYKVIHESNSDYHLQYLEKFARCLGPHVLAQGIHEAEHLHGAHDSYYPHHASHSHCLPQPHDGCKTVAHEVVHKVAPVDD
mmetsp:Transcript_50609/g.118212  ORF Transcript_50609/g.118212 Transcript_50609/m.118212 type:complete len:205 (-) Transcript_50609:1090-1704(-)